MQGGKFGAGFLSGGVAAFAGGTVLKDVGRVGQGVARSVIGGLSAELGGGKFANGAVTAAFGYLFNELAHQIAQEPGLEPVYPEALLPVGRLFQGIGSGLRALFGVEKSAPIIFKTGHYASRLEAAGLDVARTESAIAREIEAMRPSMTPGADVGGRIRIDRVLVEYRTRLLPDGSVNVGTIFPVK